MTEEQKKQFEKNWLNWLVKPLSSFECIANGKERMSENVLADAEILMVAWLQQKLLDAKIEENERWFKSRQPFNRNSIFKHQLRDRITELKGEMK